MQILEVGCGIGQTACYMAQHIVPQGHVVAFDQSADLVAIAKQNAADAGIDNITFHCSKAEQFNYPADYFDLAHTRYVLSYLPTAQQIIQKIFHASKPGGIFFSEEIYLAYAMHNPPVWFIETIDWFRQLISSGGGNPNYGLEQLPSDMLSAGFTNLETVIRFPNDRQKFFELMQIALSNEMKKPLVELSIATAEEVDDCIQQLHEKVASDSYFHASSVSQVTGIKK